MDDIYVKPLRELAINDYAKISRNGERFWVIVEGKTDAGYVGKVNNDLIVAPYKFGEQIAFLGSEIISAIPSEEIDSINAPK